MVNVCQIFDGYTHEIKFLGACFVDELKIAKCLPQA